MAPKVITKSQDPTLFKPLSESSKKRIEKDDSLKVKMMTRLKESIKASHHSDKIYKVTCRKVEQKAMPSPPGGTKFSGNWYIWTEDKDGNQSKMAKPVEGTMWISGRGEWRVTELKINRLLR
eukprot:TRINITY_DN4437_c0_g1_i1.p1 TRINITY_DN4437_c0_g1~~TRINITY_DN4437_c0_g1_i1.p1  ORF type:complete len:122 (+),score=29.78 TRINITY_DN4437_c0_g1_i1:77-442(+)